MPGVEAVVAIVAGFVAIATGVVKGGGWLLKKGREKKARKQQQALAAQGSEGAEDRYPVRFTCREETEFHPGHGYRDGYVFEVFNHSEKPVTVNGFGLDLEMYLHDEWHEYEQAVTYPPVQFPRRLAPNDALEGSIDTEGLLDELHPRKEEFRSWKPYVAVAGFGKKYVKPEKEG